jgi:acetyltransferase-like isoleucine patch superfamily enzyme
MMNLFENVYFSNLIKYPLKRLSCYLRGVNAGLNTHISFFAELKNPGNISLGSNVAVEKHARLECIGKTSNISIGNHTYIRPYATIKPDGCKVRIGDNCRVNDFSVINGAGNITIGSNVHIGAQAMITSVDHIFSDSNELISKQGITNIGITIEDNVIISASAVILDGVNIGTGSVIGAGAVVTRDIPPFSIAVGVPARVIKQRNQLGSNQGIKG